MNKIYAIYRNADMEEGRGPMLLMAAFATKQAAIDFINFKFANDSMVPAGMTPWEFIESGKSGGWLLHELREIEVYESADMYILKEKERIRQQALNKLSEAERRALGFG